MKYYEENSAAMSEDDDNVDIESDDGDDLSADGKSRSANNQYFSQAEKRAHHNALERKRRDHIKDSFTSLRDSVPSLQGEKASRAQILKKAAEYIQFMRRKNNSHQQDIDDLKRQNSVLEAQIRTLERARASGNFAESSDVVLESIKSDISSHESTDNENEMDSSDSRRNKRMKTSTY
ncbi:CLUMA_CG016283, isoform A [Clunio marinus]|uniref:Protein max n=1 Tax=Clunio marinus TaxID=568069 RepID=A0A1J1ITG3_9DIPT|nr:CLUMA_CG016283, isoform A [Clunio marinus]